jgi:hypothetical protein
LFRISLPVPVMCTLFATALRVFILGIFVFSFRVIVDISQKFA